MRPTQLSLLIGSLLLDVSPAAAQTAAPSSAPATSGGAGWLWIILLLVVVGAAVWQFGLETGRQRRALSGS